MTISDTPGARFLILRDHFGGQAKAADAASTSVASWKKYEKGDLPRGETLRILAEKGISIDWLLLGEGSMMRSDGDARLENAAVVEAALYQTIDHLKIHARKNRPSSEFIRLLFIENLRQCADMDAEIEAEEAAAEKMSDVHD